MLKNYSLQELKTFVEVQYGFSGEIKELEGFTDRNFLIEVDSTTKYVLKISSSSEKEIELNLQNYILQELEHFDTKTKCRFPEIHLTLLGKSMILLGEGQQKNYIRLLRYIDGKEIWEVIDPPLSLIQQVSQITARLSLFLEKLTEKQQVQQMIQQIDVTSHSFSLENFSKCFASCKQHLDESVVQLVDSAKEEFDSIQPVLTKISKQLIHNDICVSNVIVDNQDKDQYFVCAIIDFSSITLIVRTMELAILAARINLDQKQPLKNVLQIIKSYGKIRPLSFDQKLVLYPLIKMRLAFLCLKSCHMKFLKPHDVYVNRMKEGHVRYIKAISSACSNQEFIKKIQDFQYSSES